MNFRRWLTVAEVAAEFVVDLVRGKLEPRPRPPDAHPTHRDSERMAAASRGPFVRTQYCLACYRSNGSVAHSCGLK